MRKIKSIHFLHCCSKPSDHLGERLQFALGGGSNLCRIHLRRLHHAQHRYIFPQCCLAHAADGCVAYAALGHVGYTLQRLVVAVVGSQTEVCYCILYLLALIERRAAVYAVRDAEFAHLFLQVAALRIGAIENGYTLIVAFVQPVQSEYLPCHSGTLLTVGAVAGQMQTLACLLLRIYLLVYLPFVLVNKTVGSVHNVLRRAVVALQFEQFGTCVTVLESKNILDCCPAETVYALRVIAHHTNVVLRLCQQFDDQVLRMVGILILIHEHVPEPLLVALTHLGVVAQQQYRVHQQVVKVHRIGLLQPAVILGIDGRHLVQPLQAVNLRKLFVLCVCLREDKRRFGSTDPLEHCTRTVDLVIELQIFYNLFYQTLLVGCVVDGKISRESYILCLGAQHTRTDAVERTHPQVTSYILAHQTDDTLLHLTRGFVGEGQREYMPCRYTLSQQVGNLVGQHTSLAGTGSGYHQQRTVVVRNGGTLTFV